MESRYRVPDLLPFNIRYIPVKADYAHWFHYHMDDYWNCIIETNKECGVVLRVVKRVINAGLAHRDNKKEHYAFLIAQELRQYWPMFLAREDIQLFLKKHRPYLRMLDVGYQALLEVKDVPLLPAEVHAKDAVKVEKVERVEVRPEGLYDFIFDRENIDRDCSRIAHMMDEYVLGMVQELWDAGCCKAAVELFLEIAESCCYFFVKDEHWCEYDDMYDPDYVMQGVYRKFAEAMRDGSMPADCVDAFMSGVRKLSKLESFTGYGMPMFVSKCLDEFG